MRQFIGLATIVGLIVWIAVAILFEALEDQQMQISPKASIWINVILAILTAVSTGALSFTGIVSPATATQIVAFAGVGATILNLIMHSYSSSQPGPAAPADPPVVVAAQAVANLPKDASPATVVLTKKVASEAVIDHQP